MGDGLGFHQVAAAAAAVAAAAASLRRVVRIRSEMPKGGVTTVSLPDCLPTQLADSSNPDAAAAPAPAQTMSRLSCYHQDEIGDVA